MGFWVSLKRWCFWVVLFGYLGFDFAVSLTIRRGNGTAEGRVQIDGQAPIGRIDEHFTCATLDWWPPEKCDYGKCSWHYASLLNLDLTNKILIKAVQAFSPLKIRLGGTLQDKVLYGTEELEEPCTPFMRNASELFGFTKGCLPMGRWDQLNDFFSKTGALIIFGLNALAGKSIDSNGAAVGKWDSSNAESFIRYTVEKGYPIYGWELGNELSGNGVGAHIAALQYAYDTIALNKIVDKLYTNHTLPQPHVIAPGGFFDVNWFTDFINRTGASLDVVTHHIYNLGPGVDEHLVEKILDPTYLDGEADTFKKLEGILKKLSSSAVAWVGEAGGAYNSGRDLVSNTFVYSFWYLDQLGMAATHDTKTYCRQSLIGGNYGLLNTVTFEPNPDYYSALLWHRLMGRNVLATSFTGTKKIRAYAHCAKQSTGITLLLINLDSNTTVQVTAHRDDRKLQSKTQAGHRSSLEKPEGVREEYHLRPKDGKIRSQTMLLNGKILSIDPSSGTITSLEPLNVSSSEPIRVAPFSIVFVHMSQVVLQACS